jgi:hypothetical protein
VVPAGDGRRQRLRASDIGSELRPGPSLTSRGGGRRFAPAQSRPEPEGLLAEGGRRFAYPYLLTHHVQDGLKGRETCDCFREQGFS